MTASSRYQDCVVQVFAKAPVAGKVNTRLVPHVSPHQAAELHQEFVHNRLQMCTSSSLCDVQLWCSPDTMHDFFSQCEQQYKVPLHVQNGKDLGERMTHAIRFALESYSKVIIIGTDAPALDKDLVEKSIQALDSHQLALVPAEDGGYVLLGSNVHHEDMLQNVAWGMPGVLKETTENFERLGMSFALVDQCWDVDRPEDLERYLALKM